MHVFVLEYVNHTQFYVNENPVHIEIIFAMTVKCDSSVYHIDVDVFHDLHMPGGAVACAINVGDQLLNC